MLYNIHLNIYKMKNINIFSLILEYNSAKTRGKLNVPNVSFIKEDNSIKYVEILIKDDKELNGWINESDWNNESKWDNE